MKLRFLLIVLTLGIVVCSAEARTLFLQTSGQAAPGQATDQAQAGTATVVNLPSVTFPMQTFTLQYAGAKQMADAFNGILGQGEGVTVNEQLNALIVRASEKNLKRVGELIGKLDTPPLQVQVEAKIIELKAGSGDTTNPSTLGMSWKYSKSSSNYAQFLSDVSTTAATSLGLYAQLLSGNTAAYLEALEKTIGYDQVAAPWITALNNEESSILIGQKIGYKTTFTSTTGTAQNISFLEVGTKLKFTPHINEAGYVMMEIYPSVSDGTVSSDGVPSENTTETKNKVLVKDGQTIVIGGLTKNFNSEVELGVPVLSAIPFIGMLFRRTELKTEKRDIMVLITPHIVTPQFLEAMAQRADNLNERREKWSKEKAKLIH